MATEQFQDELTTVCNVTTYDHSNSTSPRSAGTDPEVLYFSWLINTIRLIFFSLIIPLSVFGNAMTLIIVARLRARPSSLDKYLVCLAVSDLCILFTGPFKLWSQILWPWFDIPNYHVVTCKLVAFVFNEAFAFSAWVVVIMVVQRALSVVWPHRVGVLCTPRRTWLILVIVFLCSSLLYCHLLYGKIMKGNRCSYRTEYYDFLTQVFAKIDIFVYSVIPFVVLMISNVVLVSRLRASVKEAGEHFEASGKEQRKRQRKVNSISLTVLLVSLCFVVFTVPIAAWNTIDFVSITNRRRSLRETYHRFFIQSILYCIYYLNVTVNFYLYCLTGQRFRHEFLKIMCGLLCCIRRPKT